MPYSSGYIYDGGAGVLRSGTKYGAPDPWQVAAGLAPTESGATNSNPGTGAPAIPPPPTASAPTPGDPTPTGASAPIAEMAINWRSWLTDWGFPADVITALDGMARRYTPAQADLFSRDAILYLRGTEWHKKTFVGFSEGFNKGLFTDEKGYRMYVNSANDSYKRYMGRDITTNEMLAAFGSSWDPTRVDKELEAGAFVNANRNDLQYLSGFSGEGQLSEDQLKSYGQQQVGIGNTLGAGLQTKVAKAQERLRRIFEGTLATPSLGMNSGGQLSAPGLGVSTGDIGR